MLNLSNQLMIAALAMTIAAFQAKADPANTEAYTQIESDFNSAQKTTFADLAKYGEFSRSSAVTPTTTEITTQDGAWGYYIVNVVQDQPPPNPPLLLVQNYPLMSGAAAAQRLIRDDNTMTVENLFNNNNLDCYDYSKLPTALVSQETADGVVLTNNQSAFYVASPTCNPKYDKIVTTIKQTDLFLVLRIDFTKGATTSRVYAYGWKN